MNPPPSNFNPDDPRLHGFLRQLLHNAINMAMHGVIWRLPTFWLVLGLVGMIAAVIWFGLY